MGRATRPLEPSTPRSHDHATTRPPDHPITRPLDHSTTRPRDHATTRPLDHTTPRPLDPSTTRPLTGGLQPYESSFIGARLARGADELDILNVSTNQICALHLDGSGEYNPYGGIAIAGGTLVITSLTFNNRTASTGSLVVRATPARSSPPGPPRPIPRHALPSTST